MIIRSALIEHWVARESSPVDWCEKNYVVTAAIAEFGNTFSSLPMIFLPATCLITNVWDSFSTLVSKGAYIQMFFMIGIGMASMYVHSTLSLLAQFFDEIGIAWSLFMGYSFLLPNQHRPKFYFGNHAHILSTSICIILTVFWYTFPYLNGFILMSLSLPILFIHVVEIAKYKNPDTIHITKITVALLSVAMLAWMGDIFMCSLCRKLFIPGLHSLWHVMISLGAYLTVTIFAFRKAVSDAPSVEPTIRYLTWKGIGIPYVHCVKRETLLSPN
ncbi:Ceramidase [Trinorchestia longiramus]|nr:Ceramidase [Trinorchestia longiramus]